MSGKIFVWLLATVLLTAVFPAKAQQPTKIPRIGFVAASGDAANPGFLVELFQQGLRDVGLIEGKNILVEYRYAEGKVERIQSLVAELVQLKVDVLVSANGQAISAARAATKTIPIVMITNVDPVATGLIESLAKPGGNLTGVTRLTRELSGKRLELLTEAVSKLARVGILRAPQQASSFKEYEPAARALKIQLQSLEVQGPNPDLDRAFQAATKGRLQALLVMRSPLLNRYPTQIAELAIKYQMPSMYEGSEYVEAGGLMSYTANQLESFRRAAILIDKILKGAKPADLPVEQAMKFEFVINLKAAKQIGLTVPANVLARADRVIR